ncbi:hypothetical protein CFHF_15395 [Caulobacter flavus]|uniref:GmrSD restriction endonucleases N-terminal domain-containing protein n=1 Tax=Caulobacter flavus TaxID=1679497 RepID=A0A2N5CS58_9CAUL|nr:DUF262 domain-containing protein [Caulobacter flavus]AYV46517.1 hypothetical protein C1707_09710 [Caulobacter flavus]PLR12814.1 hypothetical protein CFHF_15395 [Caulobacter flavus]
MDRRPTTQDISWLLDLDKNGQLDLDPPYQRRSVWTAKDRRFFLDTIFRNFPSPAIFLHKVISETGAVKYYVVDGKQRLETILRFSKGKLRIAQDYGDVRLNHKRFSDLADDFEMKSRFWNYQLPVEMIDFQDAKLVKDVFDRLNRNSRKLTGQELRHAKFDGWLITKAEAEAELEVWRSLGVATRARATRMTDVQFISELIAVVLEGGPNGFSQDDLDDLYAAYDDLDELPDFDVQAFEDRMEAGKSALVAMEGYNKSVTEIARTFTHIYSLWGVLATADLLPEATVLANRYQAFMAKVEELADRGPGLPLPGGDYVHADEYREASRGASTEPAQRLARHAILSAELLAP